MQIHKISADVMRAYDIRGTYQETLHENTAFATAARFGQHVVAQGGKTIVLGYDGRMSTPALLQSVIQGFKASGAHIKDIGLCPTPMVYFGLHHLQTDASFMITGSHNPKQDNGFKMGLSGQPFYGEMIRGLNSSNYDHAPMEGTYEQLDVSKAYLDCVVRQLAPSQKKLKIAFDPGNGAACSVIHELVEKLSHDCVVINETLDGNFPAHDPDPTKAKNLAQLIEVVKQEACDFGIAFDGDADRVGLVDGDGNIFYGDQITLLIAKDILTRKPGSKIIMDVKASKILPDEVQKNAGEAIIWRTGHSLIKAKMQETGALLAGEMSGHIFIKDDYFGYDDGIYAAMRLIKIFQNAADSPKEIYAKLPKLAASEEINFKVDDTKKFTIIDHITTRLRKENADFLDIDGARVNRSNGWWLIRASNTGPNIVARVEGIDKDALAALTQEMNSYFEHAKEETQNASGKNITS